MRALMKHVLFLIALLVAVSTAQAAIDPAKVQKLLADDGASGDWFGGGGGAISGNTAVIGAAWGDDNSGSAYVFVRAADGIWSQQAKLLPDDSAAGDWFGSSVTLSGNTAVIGYPGDDNKGSAYVFVRAANGTWSQQAKLLAPDGAAWDMFGLSVAIDGNTAVIGDLLYNGKGSAYVFVRAANGKWKQQAKLLPKDGANFGLGLSVALSGGTAVIGNFGDDDKGDYSGSAYVFARAANGTWSQQAKLTASDGAAGDCFGGRVALSGGTALIGASRDKDKGIDSGSAYVFVRAANGKWTQQAKLLAPDGADGDYFGGCVAVSGNTAVISAAADDGKGSAHVFVRAVNGEWTQQAKLLAPDGADGDWFGCAALSGDTAVISASRDDDKGTDSGAAYVFGGPSVVAPVKMNMAPIYKLLLKGRGIDAPCPSCPYPGDL